MTKLQRKKKLIQVSIYPFTTHPPAIPNILVTGRIDEPYIRDVMELSSDLAPGQQTTFSGAVLFL